MKLMSPEERLYARLHAEQRYRKIENQLATQPPPVVRSRLTWLKEICWALAGGIVLALGAAVIWLLTQL